MYDILLFYSIWLQQILSPVHFTKTHSNISSDTVFLHCCWLTSGPACKKRKEMCMQTMFYVARRYAHLSASTRVGMIPFGRGTLSFMDPNYEKTATGDDVSTFLPNTLHDEKRACLSVVRFNRF